MAIYGIDIYQIGNYINSMAKNLKKIKFATYSNLETYFEKIILPQKNKSSKVIGRTLLVWDKETSTKKKEAA